MTSTRTNYGAEASDVNSKPMTSLGIVRRGALKERLRLFDRYRLREVAWLIYVAAPPDGDVIREQLQRDD